VDVVESAVQSLAVVQPFATVGAATLVLQVEVSVVTLVPTVVVMQTFAARLVTALVVVVQALASVAVPSAAVWSFVAFVRVV
jgi:hypothetical protein